MNTDYSDLSKEHDRQDREDFIFAIDAAGCPFTKVESIRVFLDGDSWCALVGEDLQSGRCGFGRTAVEALINLQDEG